MLRSGILFALLCQSCGSQLPPSLEDVTAVSVAVINDAAGGTRLVERTPDGITGRGVGFRTVPIIEDVEPMKRCGFYDRRAPTIGIKTTPKCLLVGVMIHEIGHAMGLEHTDNKHSIMYPTVDVTVTAEDAAQSLIAELVAHDPGTFIVGSRP